MPLLFRISGLFGFAMVALGAFGAHGLETTLTEQGLGWWETATFYGLVHAIAAMALSNRETLAGGLRLASILFLIGVLLFSGSLYAMALGAPSQFGMITPIGGVSFLAGWGLVVFHGTGRP